MNDPAPGAAASPISAPVALVKPRFRGVSHQGAFFVALVATVVLVAAAGTQRGRLGALIFGATLASLFGVSALYHRVDWTVAARARMRRLDHAAIFVLIAGGYTPMFLLVPSRGGGHGALWAIWIGAGIGVAKSMVWSRAPKWVTALVCVTLGWVVTGEVIARGPVVGRAAVALLMACGAIYSVGALVYAAKRPNPWPRSFGYHEIFHALVVLASAVLYAHVWCVIASVEHGAPALGGETSGETAPTKTAASAARSD